MTAVSRIVVLSSGFGGADGLSELGRQVVRALAGQQGGPPVSVYSLLDRTVPPALAGLPVAFTPGHGHRVRFSAGVLTGLNVDAARTLVVVVHAHLLPLTLAAGWRGASVAAILVGVESWKPLSRLESAALSRAQSVLAISHHTVTHFKRANPAFSALTVTVCHPAVPLLPLAGDALVAPGFALIVGRMSENERYKGHDTLLEAWPAVRAACPSARLVITGDGDDRPRLETLAAARGLAEAVTFVGAVDAARLSALYRDAAFFVMPSRGEGFGLVFLEAMRAGKPCIASPGAASEIIEDGRSGLLVPGDEASAVAAACISLFTDSALRARLGEAAAQRVTEQFEFDTFAGRFRRAVGMDA